MNTEIKNQNELMIILIRELKEKFENNSELTGPFIFFESIKEVVLQSEDNFNGYNLYSMGLLNMNITVFGVTITTHWEINDEKVGVNTILKYNGRENSFYQSEAIKSQPISTEYIDLIFFLAEQIYCILSDIEEGVSGFNIEDYYGILYIPYYD